MAEERKKKKNTTFIKTMPPFISFKKTFTVAINFCGHQTSEINLKKIKLLPQV